MAHVTDIRIGGSNIIARLGETYTDLAARFADYRAYRETVRELRNLTNRDLADLGLTRGEIHHVAEKSVYGR